MEFDVIAEIEIDGNKVEYYTNIFLSQRFNAHHEFSIQIDHDVLEPSGSFSLENSKDYIGKSVIIRLLQRSVTTNTAYEFMGIICEIGMSQSQSSTGDLIIKGYSPTILLEDGPRLASFSADNDKTLTDIVTQTISKANCATHVDPKFTGNVKYTCQYKESSFHFVNRLSSDYGELFYYNGKTLIFGNPSVMEFVQVNYGEDLSSMQLNLHVEPIEAVKYAYNSLDDNFIASKGSDIDGLDTYASHVVQVSNKLYSVPDALPLVKSVDTENELKNFVKKNKEAIAAGLVVLTGTSNNPGIFLGCVADVKISRRDGNFFKKEDYGIFLVTGITHHITANGKYYNTFEGLSGWVRGIPVYNAARPIAEPQFGKVVANKDLSHLHRVRVKLEWQIDPEKTPWIWVMTPDAGSGKDGAGGAGFVFTPQIGDRVLVGFEHNNPDMPFVMGSVFHGKSGKLLPPPKTAPGKIPRCISAREESTASVCIVGDGIWIVDGNANNIILDGNGKIAIESSEEISLTCGSSSIILPKDGQITINGSKLIIQGDEILVHGSKSATTKTDDATFLKVEGTEATIQAITTTMHGTTTAEINGDTDAKIGGTNITIKSVGPTKINGATVDINT